MIRTLAFTAFMTLTAPLAVVAQDRLPVPGNGIGGGEGVRLVKPGAILFASFDSNMNTVIELTEIEAGAKKAFGFADENADGALSPIEQRAWAGKVASETDVIANPRLFPARIPGQVSEEEFVIGLTTFAERFADEDGVIYLSSLSFTPERGRDRGNDDDVQRLRRPVIGDRRGSSPRSSQLR